MEQPNPYSAPLESPQADVSVRRSAGSALLWFCVVFYALAALLGAREALIGQRTPSELVLELAVVLCLGMWATGDARRRGRPIPRSVKIWFYVLALIVVPGYVIVTRGWKGLGWVVLHVVGWVVVTTLAMHVAGFSYFGDAWWEAISPAQS
jgi:hypothetical protein